jgi:hypothetical protein
LKWFCKPDLMILNQTGHTNLTPELAQVFFLRVQVRYEDESGSFNPNRSCGHGATRPDLHEINAAR